DEGPHHLSRPLIYRGRLSALLRAAARALLLTDPVVDCGRGSGRGQGGLVPQIAAVPEIPVVPEVAAVPEVAVVPEITAAREVAAVPEVAAAREAAAVPEITAAREIGVVPEVALLIDRRAVLVHDVVGAVGCLVRRASEVRGPGKVGRDVQAAIGASHALGVDGVVDVDLAGALLEYAVGEQVEHRGRPCRDRALRRPGAPGSR